MPQSTMKRRLLVSTSRQEPVTSPAAPRNVSRISFSLGARAAAGPMRGYAVCSMPSIVLATLNSRYSHAALGLRCLRSRMLRDSA
jgi:hypothetical protein